MAADNSTSPTKQPTNTTAPPAKKEYVGAPLYTTAEWKWLNDHWGGETHFLMAYQLKICEDDDREEGRAIVRAIMKADEDDEREEARERERVGKDAR
jgi:hypothetical protein